MLLDMTRRTGASFLTGRLTATAAILVVMTPQAAAPQQQPPQELVGRVVEDSSGEALASAELRFHAAGMHELAADLETDREGRFRAPGLPPGNYSVDVSKPNYVTIAFQLHVPGVLPVVRLVRYGVISGQATASDGKPLPGVLLDYGRTVGSARISVLVKRAGSEELQLVRQTALEDGLYRVHDLPPGEYVVGLWYSGLKDGSGIQLYPDNAHPRFFKVSGGEDYRDVNFSVRPSVAYRVSGKVELPKPGVTLALALGSPEQPMLPLARTLAQADGSFHFDKIRPGSYDLFAAGPANGYTQFDSILDAGSDSFFGRTRIEISGQDVEGVAVPTTAGRSFSVVLRSRGAASPAAGCPQSAAISLTPLEPWGLLLQIKADARFVKEQTISNVPPGRFRVIASGLGKACFQRDQPIVDLSAAVADPVAVELVPAGSIHGVLHAESGRPADFVVVLLDAEISSEVEAKVALPDADGQFRFEGLRPGRYRMAAPSAIEKSSGRWSAEQARMVDVTVPAGAPIDVQLTPAEGSR
jgi:hypothetical protein